jgi:hypothetical protein
MLPPMNGIESNPNPPVLYSRLVIAQSAVMVATCVLQISALEFAVKASGSSR